MIFLFACVIIASGDKKNGGERVEKQRTYIAIDLKSFYASVECILRGLDPMTTNLLVADTTRTEKTICLAVSPSLKQHGISGRARLFELQQQLRNVNARRLREAGLREFRGKSWDDNALRADKSLEIDYIAAPPQMARYMDFSTQVYKVYMKYAAPEDIHVYSIDEVFIDATDYIRTRGVSPREYTMTIIRDVLSTVGVTATAGIGSNMYLCKVAMDIVAKRIPADQYGVRIAELDEMSYREKLWEHRPLTDFWRVGRGYAEKLHKYGLYTMGDIARCSLWDEGLLYKLFGVNAELLIDHAWGWESCTIKDVKGYKPENNSLCSGQVLTCPYTADKARLVLREMADMLSLDLVEKGLVTDQLVLTVGYDIENLSDPGRRAEYKGEVTTDPYGRTVPKHAHGTGNIGRYSSSTRELMKTATELFDRIIDEKLLVRRFYLTANHVIRQCDAPAPPETEQMDIFTDYEQLDRQRRAEACALEREKRQQAAILAIKNKFGKNAILRGMNLEEGATAMDRNSRIGGHRA